MTFPSLNEKPVRGEVWWVRFDPVKGDEIAKQRPAVVVSVPWIGKLGLCIVAPVTDWKPKYVDVPWLTYLKSNQTNGLKKNSAVDSL